MLGSVNTRVVMPTTNGDEINCMILHGTCSLCWREVTSGFGNFAVTIRDLLFFNNIDLCVCGGGGGGE